MELPGTGTEPRPAAAFIAVREKILLVIVIIKHEQERVDKDHKNDKIVKHRVAHDPYRYSSYSVFRLTT